MRSMTLAGGCAILMLALLGPPAAAQTITQIIDATGDGIHTFSSPTGVAVETAVEGAGNVYVASLPDVFQITPGGTISQIIGFAGDGTSDLIDPRGVTTDASGNVYVTGWWSDNVFKITPEGTITEILDLVGDGANSLDGPWGVATDVSGNVYVAGVTSNNVFKITPGGTITEIIDATGDGTNLLGFPMGITTDVWGNMYVAGSGSANVFKITPGGTVTEIIDVEGDGTHDFFFPTDVAVDGSGNVYVTSNGNDKAFKITAEGTITQIIDAAGDGSNGLSEPFAIDVDAVGNVYVTGAGSDNAFKIAPGGTITEIIDAAGAGSGFDQPEGIAVEGSGIVYVTGVGSDNAFKITPPRTALSAVAGLIVPGFEVEVEDPDGATTYFAIRNTTDQQVIGRADYFGVGSSEPLRTDPFVLDPQATRNINVRTDLAGLEIDDGLATGFIVVTEFGETTAPNLEGDYFRLDWGNDFAAGDRLVRPADFCLRQEIRFVDFGAGSQLRILLNRPQDEGEWSYSYRAYNEAGAMVASGGVSTSDYLSVLDASELGIEESFGTLLFDFLSSGGGWVSAKYSAFGRFSVEINAACRDRLRTVD